jgi:hypothetical protein
MVMRDEIKRQVGEIKRPSLIWRKRKNQTCLTSSVPYVSDNMNRPEVTTPEILRYRRRDIRFDRQRMQFIKRVTNVRRRPIPRQYQACEIDDPWWW